MKLTALNNHAYACLGETKKDHIRENCGFIISQDGVIVIDTTWTLTDAAWMYRQIRSITENEILFIINTHHHPDHVFGNQIFGADITVTH